MLVVCERWVGDGDRLLFWPRPLQHFFLILVGLLNRGSLRAQNPLSAADSQFGILYPTDSKWLKPPRVPVYIIVQRTPASAYSSAYSVEGQNVTVSQLLLCSIVFFHFTCRVLVLINLFSFLQFILWLAGTTKFSIWQVHFFVVYMCILKSLLVDKILLPRNVN